MTVDRNKIRICLVGPVPPPFGGMAVQTTKLQYFLRKEMLDVKTIPVNMPFPKKLCFVDNIKYIRAIVRFLFYFVYLGVSLKRVDLIHILANSYLSFFLYTAPVVFIGKLYKRKIIINYRGGGAQEFFKKHKWSVCQILQMADAIIVPSGFLVEVFKKYNFVPSIIPNIVNLEEFYSRQNDVGQLKLPVRLFVARNLTEVYNISCAIRAFHHVQKVYPESKLVIIGEGDEEHKLKSLVSEMGLRGVSFLGRVDNKDLPEIYRSATIALNPSNVDNLPISILEAFASGVPVVSTNVGGVPYMIKHGVTGLLVNKDDDEGMAECVLRLIRDKDLYQEISKNGQKEAMNYSWEYVKPRLFSVYKKAVGERFASF